MNAGVETLDLRPLPPVERHKKIFQKWEALQPGEVLRIINDHDPKPLYYQFEAEQKVSLSGNTSSKGRWTGL